MTPVMKKSFVFFTLIILASQIYSQENRYNKGLLWEISGNGLQKPSYLFGTIHASQEKFFELNDSVFLAIESAESFAGELNMDSLQHFAVRSYQRRSPENQKEISEILTKEEFDLLKEKIKKRLGIDIDALPTKDPALIALMLQREEFKGNMPCFLDEYLYKIAKSRGKIVYGIESFDDQMNLIESLNAEQRKEFLLEAIKADDEALSKAAEKLFLAYLNEDLNKISNLVSSVFAEESELQQKFIFERNVKMAEKIVKYAEDKSVFAAVGTAHLPGEKGIINLLHKKGYSLRPVQNKRTDLSGKYKKEMLETEWVLFTPESGGFSVEMPGKALSLPIGNQIPGVKIESGFYAEFGSKTNFIAAKYTYPIAIDDDLKDSVYHSLINNLKNARYEVLDEIRDIEQEGISGKEFKAEVNSYLSVSRVFIRGNSLYMLQVIHTKSEEDSKSLKKFFNSLKILDEKVSVILSDYYENERGAFKVKFNNEPFHQIVNDSTTHIFSAPDKAGQSMNVVIYAENYKPLFYSDDSVTIRSSVDEILSGNDGKIEYYRKADSEFPFYEYKILSDQDIYTGKTLLRGGRIYMIANYCRKEKYNSAEVESFLNSFELTDYKPVKWNEYTNPENSFTVNIPGTPVPESDTLPYSIKHRTIYSSMDSSSGTAYSITKYILSEYYWPENDSSLVSVFIPVYSEKSAVLQKDTLIEKLKIKEFILKADRTHYYFRYKLFITGSTAYLLEVSASENFIRSDRVEPFFNSFRIQKTDSSDLYKDKTDLFFSDLGSEDSLRVKNAALYCDEFNFKEEHLERIYNLLNKKYPDDNDEKGVRNSLLEALGSIKSDSKINFIKSLYPGLSETSLQLSALEVLTNMNTPEAAEVFLNLILDKTPHEKQKDYYFLFSPFYDSLKNLTGLFPRVLKLLEYEEYKNSIYSLLKYGIDSSVVEPAQYSGYEKLIIADCKKLIAERDSLINDEEYFGEWKLIDVIGTFPAFENNPEAVEILKKLVEDSSFEISSVSAVALLKLNRKVSPEIIKKITASPETRNSFYEELNKLSKTELFPSEYLTQEAFAEGDFLRMIYNDYDGPAAAELLETRTNDEGIFYLYKFKTEEFDYWYAGISGPQPVNGFVSKGRKTKTNYYQFDEMTIEEHWENLLKEEDGKEYE